MSGDWEDPYGDLLDFAETFVDPARFREVCYAASNWTRLGRTKWF